MRPAVRRVSRGAAPGELEGRGREALGPVEGVQVVGRRPFAAADAGEGLRGVVPDIPDGREAVDARFGVRQLGRLAEPLGLQQQPPVQIGGRDQQIAPDRVGVHQVQGQRFPGQRDHGAHRPNATSGP
jgi:hypothetical protein